MVFSNIFLELSCMFCKQVQTSLKEKDLNIIMWFQDVSLLPHRYTQGRSQIKGLLKTGTKIQDLFKIGRVLLHVIPPMK